ncbi:olfactory receptor 1L3-like [Myxocyprinus asiaticus]|uniref:olfactory receptor 1L3-like n=1 Tax=Myxocyprinus asiaticus TaxID=70543 RepID=UPI002222496C|nr:olfactory receptor 1L3-like [Myxocyprinus asiaticus]
MDNLTFRYNILLVEGLKVTPQSSHLAFILLLIAYIFIMVANIGILIQISAEKSLHQPMHILYCNLPLSDVLGTNIIVPRLLKYIFMEPSERYITYVECVIQIFFAHLYGTTSHTVLMIGLTVRLSHCRYVIQNPFCDNASLFKLSCENVVINNVYGLTFTIVLLTSSLGSVATTYLRIAIVCFKSKNKATNSKAIKTCSTHLACYVIMMVSGFTTIFLHRFPELSDSRKLSTILFHVVPPCLNPIIYGLQAKEIRQRIFQLFNRNKVNSK